MPEPSITPEPIWEESASLEPAPDANPDADPAESPITDTAGSGEPDAAAAEPVTIDQLESMLTDQDEDDGRWEEDFSLRPLRFRGVTVGETSLHDLLELWGKPFTLVKSPESRIVKYRTPPFRQVDVTVVEDTVVAILIHLQDFLDPIHCSRQLRLSHLEPIPVSG